MYENSSYRKGHKYNKIKSFAIVYFKEDNAYSSTHTCNYNQYRYKKEISFAYHAWKLAFSIKLRKLHLPIKEKSVNELNFYEHITLCKFLIVIIRLMFLINVNTCNHNKSRPKIIAVNFMFSIIYIFVDRF